MPKVSIIIPTYNRGPLLYRALQSVLNQSFKDYEIILIDDGSTDDTREIVKKIDSPKIRYVYQKNRGRSQARNEALKLVQGEYVAYLDSDDQYLPGSLAIQVAELDSNPEVGMVYGAAKVVDEQSNPIEAPYKTVLSGRIYWQVAYYLPHTILLPTVMVRRAVQEKVGFFDTTLDRFEDTDMWRRITRDNQAKGLPEYLALITTHQGNTLEPPPVLWNNLARYTSKVRAEDKKYGWLFHARAGSRLYYHYGKAIFANKNDWEAASRRFFIQSIKLWPLFVGSYCYLAASYIGKENLRRIKRFIYTGKTQ